MLASLLALNVAVVTPIIFNISQPVNIIRADSARFEVDRRDFLYGMLDLRLVLAGDTIPITFNYYEPPRTDPDDDRPRRGGYGIMRSLENLPYGRVVFHVIARDSVGNVKVDSRAFIHNHAPTLILRDSIPATLPDSLLHLSLVCIDRDNTIDTVSANVTIAGRFFETVSFKFKKLGSLDTTINVAPYPKSSISIQSGCRDEYESVGRQNSTSYPYVTTAIKPPANIARKVEAITIDSRGRIMGPSKSGSTPWYPAWYKPTP